MSESLEEAGGRMSLIEGAVAPPLDPSMICMSVVEDGPRIAFAAYNEDLNQIVLENCMADGYETQDVVERVLATVRPNLLLVSSKIVANDTLLEVLTTPPPQPTEGLIQEAQERGPNENANNATDNGIHHQQQQRSIPYRLMKTAAFDVRNCKALILQKLRVRSLMKQQQGNGGHHLPGQPVRHFPLAPNTQSFAVSTYHSLASIIDFESTVLVKAVGSLLSFLHNTIFRLEEGGYITINDVVHAKASAYMNLSAQTLSALHIFATEHHPLVAAKGAGNSKEGFSLFSLMDRTKSRSGRQRLREWMLKPLLDAQAIAVRQNGVELMMQPEMQAAAGSILSLLEHVGAVDKILVRIQKCCAKPTDFLILTRTLSAGVTICLTLQQEILWKLEQQAGPHPSQGPNGEPIELWDEQAMQYKEFVEHLLRRCHVAALQDLLERITSIVDEEATNECQSVVIRTGYHEQLDAFKQQYDSLAGKKAR